MPKKKELIDGLNEDLNLELTAVIRYLYHAATATGMLGHELRELATKEMLDELRHAAFLADKIAVLGGEPEFHPAMPGSCKNAKAMLEENAEAERQAIANYTERAKQAEAFGDRGLAIRLEDLIAEETDHLEDLLRLGR